MFFTYIKEEYGIEIFNRKMFWFSICFEIKFCWLILDLQGILEKNSVNYDFVGTPLYAAPEIHNKDPYTNSIEIWYLGIILFYMLAKRYPFPFSMAAPNQTYKHLKKNILNLSSLTLKNCSLYAIDLITKMCDFDLAKRITAEDILSLGLTHKKLNYK